MYGLFRDALLDILRAPKEPPEPPATADAKSVQIFRASKRFLIYRLLGLAVVASIGLMIGLAVLSEAAAEPAGRVVIAVFVALTLLGAACGYFLIRLEYDMRYYVLTDRAMRIREGILTIREVTVTYANVQHLEVRRGPIQQLLGIADIIVRTAGGGIVAAAGHEGKAAVRPHEAHFRGIENAEELRDRIQSLLWAYRDAGLGDPEDAQRARRRAAAAPPAKAAAILREIRDDLRAWRTRLEAQ